MIYWIGNAMKVETFDDFLRLLFEDGMKEGETMEEWAARENITIEKEAEQ